MILKPSIFILIFFTFLNLSAQENKVPGKIIENFGSTYRVESPDIETNSSLTHRVIFDVSRSGEDRESLNAYIETAARFLNMHADQGMRPEQLQVAMTIHGGAWQDILNDTAYMQRFGVSNPNSGLIKNLLEAGVDVILCGQTMQFREIKSEEKIPGVKVALSAMTALLQYQHMNYKFIKF